MGKMVDNDEFMEQMMLLSEAGMGKRDEEEIEKMKIAILEHIYRRKQVITPELFCAFGTGILVLDTLKALHDDGDVIFVPNGHKNKHMLSETARVRLKKEVDMFEENKG